MPAAGIPRADRGPILPGGTLGILGGGQLGSMFAVAILALEDARLRKKLLAYRAEQTARVLAEDLDGAPNGGSLRTSER